MTGVPLTAVFDRDGKEYVWVVSDRAEAELREVTLGDLYGSDMVHGDSGARSRRDGRDGGRLPDRAGRASQNPEIR